MTASPPPEVAAVLAEAIKDADGIALDNLHADWARQSVAATLEAALTAAGLLGGGTREVSNG